MAAKKRDEEERSLFGFLGEIEPSTRRGVLGVILFVIAIILGLSSLGMAGMAGQRTYEALSYLFGGVGFVFLLVALIAFAATLFRTPSDKRVGPLKATGAMLFLLSTLGIVQVISGDSAGVIGKGVALPLLYFLEVYATVVLLIGILLVALLVLFDAPLWIELIQKMSRVVRNPFHRNAEVSEEDDVVLDEGEADEVGGEEEYDDEEALEEGGLEEGGGEDEDAPEEDEIEDEEEDAKSGTFGGLFSKRGKNALDVSAEEQYSPPPVSLLEKDKGKPSVGDTKANANIIKRTLQNFGIRVEMDEVTVGPTVTRYSLKPAEGVRLSKILGLQSNLELSLAASPLRIEAPIPGKSLVGVEVPNAAKATVGLASLLSTSEFTESAKPLLVALGRDIAGASHYADVAKMPHALIAGATGSGKSVTIHALITSLLYRNGPERLRMILVDPKRVELTLYNNIPHLLTPVITDAKKTILSLKWAAREMDRRYDILQAEKVRDIASYHSNVLAPAKKERERLEKKGSLPEDFEMPEQMPHIVIIIDELADIMQTYPRELEAAIVRLAQMSRAVGIHLLLSTQRPSVNVITGLIKANIPARVALQVASQIDSRTILDGPGAEKLLGAGDMLYLSGEMSKPRRIQSPYITETEVKKVVSYLTKHNDYDPEAGIDLSATDPEAGGFVGELEGDNEGDEYYESARELVIEAKKASTSYLQRKLSIGYGRAAKLMDMLEERGVIGPQNGSKPREVLIEGGGESGEEAEEEQQY